MAEPSPAAGPFDGVRVFELTRGIAGRTAGMLLADLGADVVRACDDRPDEARDPGGLCWDRGKVLTPLSLPDSSSDSQVLELRRLTEAADVVVTDLRPAQIAGHWLTAADIARRSPRVVHAWLPPQAPRGRWSDLPDDPLLLAAVGGYADHFPASRERPVAQVVPVLSYVQGALGAAAIAAALVGRGADGPGRSVVVTGLHAVGASQESLMLAAEDGTEILSVGKRLNGAPNFRIYRAGDGNWFYLAALTPGLFFRALEILDRMDVLVREDVAGEFTNLLRPGVATAVGADLAVTFATRPRADWLRLLADAQIPAAPVSTREEWLAGELASSLGARLEKDHSSLGRVVLPGIPVTLSATPGRVRHLPSGDHVATAESIWPGLGPHERRGGEWPWPAARTVDRPLAGIRVIDISTFLAAPFASALLADFGADVVKIEAPDGDPYRVYSASYTAVNQRKRAAALDLREPDQRGALLRLAADADVLVDNLLPASLSRLGLGDGVLSAACPRLVRCSVSAFGRTGPWAERPGFDPIIQALSGMMLAQGGAGDPVASVAPTHDVATGALAAFGILAALFDRVRSGQGQHVTASLAATSTFLQSAEFTTFDGRPPASVGGHDFPGPSAVRRYYRTSDGWLAVAAAIPAQVSGLLEVAGHLEWGELDDAALADRLSSSFAQRPVEAWLSELAARAVPASHVLPRVGELADPFLVENDFSHVVVDPVAGKLRVVRGYADWLGTGPGRAARGSTVGEQTAEILAEAGITLESKKPA
jgi:crotonobetainyl-CoA:carnitine CoA-transferase CaiB-like acyl-CoA transferase